MGFHIVKAAPATVPKVLELGPDATSRDLDEILGAKLRSLEEDLAKTDMPVRVGRYELSSNPFEGVTIYPVAYLAGLPTLATGHFANLQLKAGGFRFWLSRCYGAADDDPWQVRVDHQDHRGDWVTTVHYRETPQ